IRGFRIEIGEIEAMLLQHDSIREAVVIADEDTPGEKRLIAYVVPEPELPFSLIQLDQHLRTRLPQYMLPARIIKLEQLPRSPNGKIDRRALPAPDTSDRIDEATYVAPGTPLEELIAETWSQVLGIERVGIFDNFFELGGHSLLMTSIYSRIRTIFKVELPLRDLYKAPTVAELATLLIKYETAPGQMTKIAELHKKIAAMPASAVRKLLHAKQQAAGG
ncbi:MAG TPA: phosphopantetheine-binding protein, partial [Ktedonobacteraceae bacterium]|nr:phosphopantetheine-binding protein [Ktedonobacteraceae bacterium]